jgi:hypothetical protein
MNPVPVVDTFREVLEKDTREHSGHIYAIFECEHWIPVCMGIARRLGFEEYLRDWSKPNGAHCRCGFEDEDQDYAVYVREECPRCVQDSA